MSNGQRKTGPSGIGGWLNIARRDPKLVARRLGQAARNRTIGPLTASRRPGVVAMWHLGRSGSTVLGGILRQHPKIHWDGETYWRLFHPLEVEGRPDTDITADPVDHIQSRYSRSGSRWFGYEVKFRHLERFGAPVDQYVDRLLDTGVNRFVLLERRNMLRTAVSVRIATERGFTSSKAASDVKLHRLRLDPEAVRIDTHTRSLTEHFTIWRQQFAEVRQLAEGRIPMLDLNYEDHILEDPHVAFAKMTEFLGLETTEVEVQMRRLNPYPLREVIENFDDVAGHLTGTEHEWMLDD